MPPLEIFEWLNAGGNLAMMALVYIMWKFDRRLVRMETIIENLVKLQASLAQKVDAK